VKVLLAGDLAGTGFGSVTQDLGRAWLAMGLDLRFVSQNELGDLPEPFASRTFSVNDSDGWMAMARKQGVHGLVDGSLWPDGWKPDAVVILGDYIGVRLVVMSSPQSISAFGSVPTWHYMPVEGIDLPPKWAEMWEVIRPVAMSNFGADQIERITGKRPPVVYHGVDTDVFKPVTPSDPLTVSGRRLRSKADCKAIFMHHPGESWKATAKRAEAQKWLLRTDRLMPRKRYPSLLRSLAPVLHAFPDTVLVTHCLSDDQGGNLYDLFSKYPEHIRSRMLNTGFHDQAGGASRDILRALYNAADVYVTCSAEGFGLTIAEAIACGTPVVGLDYSAVPEVVGPAGLLAPVGVLMDSEYGFPWAGVNEEIFGSMVTNLLQNATLRASLGAAGPAHVRDTFQWATAAQQFADLIRGGL
jgi:glycosyltransferase involved in cell wall biosynthesis